MKNVQNYFKKHFRCFKFSKVHTDYNLDDGLQSGENYFFYGFYCISHGNLGLQEKRDEYFRKRDIDLFDLLEARFMDKLTVKKLNKQANVRKKINEKLNYKKIEVVTPLITEQTKFSTNDNLKDIGDQECQNSPKKSVEAQQKTISPTKNSKKKNMVNKIKQAIKKVQLKHKESKKDSEIDEEDKKSDEILKNQNFKPKPPKKIKDNITEFQDCFNYPIKKQSCAKQNSELCDDLVKVDKQLLKITNSEKKQKSDEKILPKTNNFVDELIDDMDVCPEVDKKNGIKISDNFIKKFDEHDSVQSKNAKKLFLIKKKIQKFGNKQKEFSKSTVSKNTKEEKIGHQISVNFQGSRVIKQKINSKVRIGLTQRQEKYISDEPNRIGHKNNQHQSIQKQVQIGINLDELKALRPTNKKTLRKNNKSRKRVK